MQRSKLPYFFLALAALLAAAAGVIWVLKPGVKSAELAPPPEQASLAAAAAAADPTSEPAPVVASRTVLADPGTGASAADAGVLVARIAKALEAGDLARLSQLTGKDPLDSLTIAKLTALTATPVKLRQPGGVREVGELELNSRSRWLLTFADRPPGYDQLSLDLRLVDGKWKVEKLLPPPNSTEPLSPTGPADSLTVTDAFLQAVLKQDFESARTFVDPTTVSDTKIAGLCILFEEGEYHLRNHKPLRSMFQRPDTVGYLANVETKDAKQVAQFSMTLKKSSAPDRWIVAEINLNQLLADYARRVAGGDLYYSPLVQNPAGGDTLALYFDFDEDAINPRTRRQLEIVTLILKSDPGKKITLSGHTDALGTKQYNNDLSSRRADVVCDFLTQAGVSVRQIITLAKGDSQPRRPNLTETGSDSPQGRRANRRTEIYLDF
jgi:OmpA-OmpF porin, OOP family